MISRGRKSAAEKSALATMSSFERGARPAPSARLEPDAAEVWQHVVDAMPPDWFPPETYTMLEMYCNQVAGLKFIDKSIARIQQAAKPDINEWRKLVNLRRAESKAISMLATKMRLTQQSSYNAEATFTAKKRRAFSAPAAPTHPWS